MIALAVILALALGITCGYLYAITRTPALIARMTPAELRTLADRVAHKRNPDERR